MPITWRNVDSDTTRGAAALMEVSRRAFNDGLGNLQQAVQQVNQNRADNWETQRQVNTDAFLDRLAQFSTPEQLAAAQQSGELAALRQQFGGQIDRDAIRGAEANAGDLLMKRITAQNQFADDKTNRDARPLIDQFNSLLSAGKLDEAQKFLDTHVLGTDETSFAQNILARRDKSFSQGMEQKRFGLQAAADARAQTEFNDRQTELLQNRAVLGGVQSALSGADSLATARANLNQLAKDNNWRADHVAKGLQQLDQMYQAQTGLTSEQDAAVSSHVADLERAAKLAEENAKGNSVFSNPEVRNMTQDQAVAKVIARVPGEEDDTVNRINYEVEQFRKKNNIPDSVNLGAVVDQVLGATGKDDTLWRDDTLDFSKFQSNLSRVYGEFNKFEQSQADARAARKLVDDERLKKQNEFRAGNIRANLK